MKIFAGTLTADVEMKNIETDVVEVVPAGSEVTAVILTEGSLNLNHGVGMRSGGGVTHYGDTAEGNVALGEVLATFNEG